ncbi:hypothetical protein M0R45_010410 [Rubus argutus]|uniref:Uncharacterized protein n=1 Tax=Rubus argutus TaxID=59490 RepID=A0AAW1Y6W8_RUBAR
MTWCFCSPCPPSFACAYYFTSKQCTSPCPCQRISSDGVAIRVVMVLSSNNDIDNLFDSSAVYIREIQLLDLDKSCVDNAGVWYLHWIAPSPPLRQGLRSFHGTDEELE